MNKKQASAKTGKIQVQEKYLFKYPVNQINSISHFLLLMAGKYPN